MHLSEVAENWSANPFGNGQRVVFVHSLAIVDLYSFTLMEAVPMVSLSRMVAAIV